MNPPRVDLYVGRDFDSSDDLKQACRDFAVQETFEFTTERSNKKLYTIKCKIPDCPWRLYASSIEGSRIFRIKTFKSEHTCFGINHPGNKQATAASIASRIAEKLRDQPSYRPVDLVSDVKRDMGIEITYAKALRAKERANEILHGTHEGAYKSLPQYCRDLEAVDPNTKAIVERTSENKFLRMFVCHGACASGFAYCRPLFGLDGTHLKHKYLGILLAATATDANGQLFPLAYAVVDAENDVNWLWFLRNLRDIIQANAPDLLAQQKTLVILSDRQKGLLEGVEEVFPNSPHGFCMKHLEENFHKQFKNVELKKLLWKAARATTQTAFDSALEAMKKINTRCVPWLYANAHPIHWAEIHFPGRRYGHFTSNICESLNAALLPAREMPILAMFEAIRKLLMNWFSEKRNSEDDTVGLVVKEVATRIQDLVNSRARRYRFRHSKELEYEVNSKETLCEYLVNIAERTCSCREWQATGIPCGHALGVIISALKEDPQTYAMPFFTLEAFKNTYAGAIIHPRTADFSAPLRVRPLSDDDDDSSEDSSGSEDVLLPGRTRKPSGRPRNKRIKPTKTREENRRVNHCGRCREAGHNKTGCSEPIG